MSDSVSRYNLAALLASYNTKPRANWYYKDYCLPDDDDLTIFRKDATKAWLPEYAFGGPRYFFADLYIEERGYRLVRHKFEVMFITLEALEKYVDTMC